MKNEKKKVINQTKHNKNDQNKKKESIFLDLDDGNRGRDDEQYLWTTTRAWEGQERKIERDLNWDVT